MWLALKGIKSDYFHFVSLSDDMKLGTQRYLRRKNYIKGNSR